MMQIKTPLPDRMKNLATFHGFPVPYVVFIDKDGTPHFKINDTGRERQCVFGKICHICGQRLLHKEYWFVGGHLSAFHPKGAFNEGAAHKECALYALQVCPYMSFNTYKTTTTDHLQHLQQNVGKENGILLFNPTQTNERLSFFCLVQADTYQIIEHGNGITVCKPGKPYSQVEYWREGERIHKAEARQILKEKNELFYF